MNVDKRYRDRSATPARPMKRVKALNVILDDSGSMNRVDGNLNGLTVSRREEAEAGERMRRRAREKHEETW